MLDFQLPDGTRLGDAAPEQVRAAAKYFEEQSAKMMRRVEAIEDGSALCFVAKNEQEEAWLKTMAAPEDPRRGGDGELFLTVAPDEVGDLLVVAIRNRFPRKAIAEMIHKVGKIGQKHRGVLTVVK